ncbi:MAG: HD domain-containing protein [Candidatus Peribacteraceae bacterium]
MLTGIVATGNAVTSLRKLLPQLNEARLKKAWEYARRHYGDRGRELTTSTSLIQSAEESTLLLSKICKDEDAIIASLLQFVLRTPDGSLEDIGKEFGRPVRDLVSRVHLLSHLYVTDWRKSVEDMKLMLVSVSDDMRVLLITLSAVTALLEHVQELRHEHRTRICKQSLQLFAPVAARLGIYVLKYQLEKRAFPVCYPTDAEHIGRQLAMIHEESGGFLAKTSHSIRDFLSEQGIRCEVMAREKQPYSIFLKMHSRSINTLEKIVDLFAIRVIVPSVEDCYQALGLLHRVATPVSGRFKDYISFPKPNGYRSLHTCVLGLPGAPRTAMVEVQIRTNTMHREAEFGIAAHWMYKESSDGEKVLEAAGKLGFSEMLLKQSVGQKKGTSVGTPISATLVDNIYVLTPQGDIIELPEGGTPLDFAFMVHTDLGLKFKGAKVNGAIVPIATKLENGDVVEIITHKHPQPTLHWLKVVRTSSARTKLKAHFFAHNRGEYLTKGKTSLNRELTDRGLPVLDNDLSLFSTVDGRALALREREDIVVKVGMDALRASAALRGVPPEKRGASAKASTRKKVRPATSAALVTVVGESLPLPYRFAQCCAPEKEKARPEILGIVTRNGRITVHRNSCHVIKGVSPTRKLPMEWTSK